jgi:membrane protein implicated in regulation of membrane protease activity
VSVSDEVAQRRIAELASAGVEHGEAELGEWTLDDTAARAKLAEYRLADVDVWPCTIVEAASLLGATTIMFEPSDETLVITFDGQGLVLDGFFARSLGSRRDASARAARKLAIALDTMLERKGVTRVDIESGHERLTLDQHAWQVRPSTRSEAGTRVVAHRVGTWNELGLLRTHARHARAHLTVKRDFPTGVDIEVIAPTTPKVDSDGTRERWPIMDGERVIGWLHHGVPWSATRNSLVIVSDGVVAETLQYAGVGELVLLDVSLDKDLGERRVLRNAEFERLLTLVQVARVAHPFVAGPPSYTYTPTPAWTSSEAEAIGPVLLAGVLLIVLILILS